MFNPLTYQVKITEQLNNPFLLLNGSFACLAGFCIAGIYKLAGSLKDDN